MVCSGGNRYRYDPCGRLIEKIVQRHGFRPQRWQYRWNSDNRLTDLYTPNDEHWRYRYDAFGRRTRKFNVNRSNVPSHLYAHSEKHIVGEEYLWNGEQLLEAAPLYADGTVAFEHATRWTYAPGGITPLAQQQGDRLWYIVTDHLGTPRELLDESGQLAWSNSPNVWGQARLWQAANDEYASSNVTPLNKTTCPLRFPGQYYDEESGLHYNRHRYYDPETAQYLSPDPLGLGGGVRPQGYVDNPLSWIDPLGLAGCIEYGELDSLGRPTGVQARLDSSDINTGTHANPNIQPPGFITGAGSNRARGHLLGRQLGGSGNDPRNLVTIQQNPVNTPVMSKIEGDIRKALENGQVVNITVTPIYKGSSRIPAGITIKAEGSGGLSIHNTVLNPPGI